MIIMSQNVHVLLSLLQLKVPQQSLSYMLLFYRVAAALKDVFVSHVARLLSFRRHVEFVPPNRSHPVPAVDVWKCDGTRQPRRCSSCKFIFSSQKAVCIRRDEPETLLLLGIGPEVELRLLFFLGCNWICLFLWIFFYNIPSGRPRIFCLISERDRGEKKSQRKR